MEVRKSEMPYFSCRSLPLSTTVLDDMHKVINKKHYNYVTGFWETVPNHTTTEIHSIA